MRRRRCGFTLIELLVVIVEPPPLVREQRPLLDRFSVKVGLLAEA